jgi:hypothetical protein
MWYGKEERLGTLSFKRNYGNVPEQITRILAIRGKRKSTCFDKKGVSTCRRVGKNMQKIKNAPAFCRGVPT